MLEPSKRGEDLLLALLAGALAMLPQADAEEMAEQVGFTYGSKLAGSMAVGEGQRSFRSALRAVADALTAHGFAAHAEARGRSLTLVKEACPFFDAAQQHPVICAVDRGMVRGMLSALYGRATGPQSHLLAPWETRPAPLACLPEFERVSAPGLCLCTQKEQYQGCTSTGKTWHHLKSPAHSRPECA